MCGIAGIVDVSAPVDAALVAAMSEAIAHRGPDDSGLYSSENIVLGFRRLSILDLSAAGHQPMRDPSGRYVLVFNGEIYNYLELRAELASAGRVFTSGTDTEVILAAFERWGEACVERFNGMWAFALWDSEKRTLFCSRDRFGIKPFFYRHDGGRFVFASELKAFCAAGLRLEPNLAAVRDFLEQSALERGERTMFDGIVQLAPGQSLSFGHNGLRVRRYWQLEHRDPPADPVAAVREALVDAVRLHLRSDVPVGTALSGGLDSSAVACVVDLLLRTDADAARLVGDRQQTFTAYFERKGFDERPFAEAVVAHTRAAPHWITFDGERLVDDLPAIVRAQDEPFGSTSIAAQWYVMENARANGVTVMLDGQGGDEIFGGYLVSYGARFAGALLGGRLRELARELAGFRSVQGYSLAAGLSALTRALAPNTVVRKVRSRRYGGGALLGPSLRALGPVLEEEPTTVFSDPFRRELELQLTRTQLPELLRYEDRNSMAHSIEARVPLLDYRLVELAFSLDPSSLIDRGLTKVVLRDAVADIVPEPVRLRTDKLGFVTPQDEWLRGRLGELAADVFASSSFADRGFVDPAEARQRLALYRGGGGGSSRELWRALSLELWAREFLDP